MTTRRTFLAGLLASAATGAAQPVPAQPVADFVTGPIPYRVFVPGRIWFLHGPEAVLWSNQDDLATWGPVP